MAGGLNRNIVVRLLADTSGYTAGMAKASADSQKLSTTMEAAGGKGKLLTAGIAAAGVAATAFGVAAVRMAADFDASMSTVQANTGASADELDQLRQAAIDAGADTVYSASESADAINELGKAGMSVSDILSGGLTGALNLAASDGMDVGEAAEYMASALTQFNLSGSDATRVADALASGAGNAQGNVHDLGEALNNSGTVANSFGLSMEETVGTLSAFANAGIVGAEAGTQLKSMLLALATQTDKQKTAMDELGISAYDAQGNFVGLANFAEQLKEKEAGLTQEQRQQANATIFGSYAIQAANILYKEGADGIRQWTDTVSKSGYAAEQAAAKNDNLKGDLENLSGSFESLMITIGEGGQGPLRSLVQGVDTLVDAFSSLPAPVQQSIVLATAAIGGFTALHSALKPLNTSTSGLAKGLGLAIDPMQRLSVAAPQLKEGFSMLGTTFATSFKALGSGTPVIGASTAAMSGLKSIGGGLVSLMGGPWGIAFAVAGAALFTWVQKAQEAKAAAESVKTAMETTGDATEALVDQANGMQVGDGVTRWFEQVSVGAKTVPELLDQVGLSLSDLVSAAQGDAGALDKVNAKINELNEAHGRGASQAGALRSALDKLTDAYDTGTESAQRKTDTLNELGVAEDEAATATDDYTDATGDAATATSDLQDQIDDLVDSFLNLNGIFLNADESVTRLNQQILDLNDTIAKNGRVLDDNGNALAGYETQAYDSQSALQSLASSAQTAAQKIIEEGQATGDMDAATQKAGDALEQAREAFIRNATSAGMSSEAAERLADRYGLARGQADNLRDAIKQIPDKKDITVNAHTEDAYNKITSMSDALAKLQDKEITITQTMRYFTENYIMNKTSDESEEWHAPLKRPTGATGGLYDGRSFLPGYASGGVVSGYVQGPGTGTSDSIWLENARIANGEFVQSAAATDYYSPGFMSLLNERRIPRDMLMKAPQWIVNPVVQAQPVVNHNVTQNFEQKIVRPADDLHVAASILYRNAKQAAGRMSR